MPIDWNKFDEAAKSLPIEDGAKLRAADIASPAPDVATTAGRLAKANGWTPIIVASNIPEFQDEARRRQLDTLAQTDPSTATFLAADPHRMGLVKDDIEATSGIGKALNGVLDFLEAPARGLRRARLGSSASSGSFSALASTAETVTDLVNQYNPARIALEGLGAPKEMSDALGLADAAKSSAGMSAGARDQLQGIGQEVGGLPTGKDWMASPSKALEQAVAHLAQSSAASAPLMAVGVATRNPTVGALAMGVPTGTMTYSDLRSQGVDRGTAFFAGLGTGAMEYGGEKLSFEALLKKPWRASILATPATEFGQEFVTQLGQDAIENGAAGKPMDASTMLWDAFDAGLTGWFTGLTMGLGRAAINLPLESRERKSAEVGKRLGTIERSAQGSNILAGLAEQAATWKLNERSPEDAEAFVKHKLGDTDANVYVAADEFNTLFQSEAPRMAAEFTGDENAHAMAGETGDIVIPLAKWTSVVSRLPNAKELIHVARMSSDALSRKEIDGLDIAGEVSSILGKPSEKPGQRESVERVKQDVLGQLLATNKYQPADAERQANLYAAFFMAASHNTGKDAFSLYEPYGLRIRTPQAAILGQRPNLLDARTDALLTAARSTDTANASGTSLVSALVKAGGLIDGGGELRGMDAGKSRIGLINKNGMDLDKAREWAVEAGYLRDTGVESGGVTTSSTQDLLDAIQSELMGTPVYSDKNADVAGQDFWTEVTDLRRGIESSDKLREMTPEQFAALSNQDLHGILFPDSLNQSAPFNESAYRAPVVSWAKSRFGDQVAPNGRPAWQNFVEWFGDSKVVDADGKPLVVFHGTGANFDTFKSVAGADMGFHFGSHEQASDRGGTSTNIIPSYLAISNPLRVTDPGYFGVEDAASGDNAFFLELRKAGVSVLPGMSHQEAIGAIEAAGYDGLVYANEAEGDGDSWVAFNPNQIKSSTANNGDFSDDPSILYQSGDTAFADAARNFFGTTKDPREAGYVLPDGSMLDFSGRHYADDHKSLRGQRSVDHRELTGENKRGESMEDLFTLESGSGSDYMHEFMARSGAMRVDFASGIASIMGEPSQQQIATLASNLRGDYAALSVVDPVSGRIIDDAEIDSPTPMNVRRFFDKARGKTAASNAPLFQSEGAPRAQLLFGPDGTFSIELLQKADLSSFLHESGHLFLEINTDLASQPDATDQMRADMDTTLTWFGIAGETAADRLAAWNAMPLDVKRPFHEKYAEGFEQYLQEGKAPSPELRSEFARFRQWLIAVYRGIKNNITLTPEVRAVFDRMLATEDQISLVESQQSMTSIVPASDFKALGLTDKQWADYQAELAAATEEAKTQVLVKLLADHKREAEAWWKEERARVRGEVMAEFEAAPAVRAWRILAGNKTIEGQPAPEWAAGMKLNTDAIKANPVWATLSPKIAKLGVMSGTGAHPDLVAGALGFSSGDELIKSLSGVKDVLARVDAEADSRMAERHPDPMTNGDLPGIAERAAHNTKRVAVMEREMAMLSKLANNPAPPMRVLRAIAERAVAGMTSRKLRPYDALVAERKAARMALQAAAKGDFAKALQYKREQAMQAALYSATNKAKDTAEAQIKELRKAGSDKTRERIGKTAGKDYVDALDSLLDGHELRPVSAKDVQRRSSLRAWIAKVQAEGSNTAVSDELLDRVERENVVNVADLTVQQLGDLHEAVKNLLHLATVKNQLKTKRGKIEWEDAKSLLVARLNLLDERHPNGLAPADSKFWDRVSDLYAAGNDWVLQPESMIEWLDGGTEGPWHDMLFNQSEEAEAKRESLNRMVGEALKSAVDALPKADVKSLNDKVHIESLGKSLSRHTIFSALLNMGNEGNRDKLKRGGWVDDEGAHEFTDQNLSEMFSNLTGPQVEMAQGIWDAVNLLWPEIVALEEETSGFAPEKIEPSSVTIITKDGPITLRGGYYPAMYKEGGSRAGDNAEVDQAKKLLSGTMPIRASTSKGHTEERTSFAAPMLLDYGVVLSRHLDGVMGDIAYRRFLAQAYKVLDDVDIKRKIGNRLSPQAVKGLKAGFERGAVGNFALGGPLFGPFQGIADATMTNISAAALGFRVPLALANTATAPILATARIKPSFLIRGFSRYYFGDGMAESTAMIQRLSPLMVSRAQARTVELRSILSNLRGQHGARKQMIELAFAVHQWIVPLAENAIWLSSYMQAQAAGKDGADAAIAADKAIRQTQTKSRAKDLSLAEGSPYLRQLMMFAGPLVVINNRLQESGLRGLKGDVKSPIQALGVWIAMAAGGSLVFDLMMGRGADDEDKDGDVDFKDWATWVARKIAVLPISGIPILREIASKIDGGFSRSNPLVDAGNSLYQFGKTAYEQGANLITGDEPVDQGKLTKDSMKAAGVVTGIPSNQAVRTGTYLMEVATGQHTPDSPKDAIYLMQGPPKE